MIFAETHTTGNRIDISAEFKIFSTSYTGESNDTTNTKPKE